MINKQFHDFSDKSGHILQSHWDTVYELFGSDPFKLWVWGTFIVTTTTYWITGLSFLLIDLTGKPKFLQKYRIQKIATYPVTFNKVLRATKQILFNQFICGIPLAFLYYDAMVWRGYDSRRNLPGLPRIAFEFLLFIFLEEIIYYYLHRFLHTPFMFKHIHRLHHEWKSPIAINAAYCHPVEHIFANIFPLLLGPFLLGSHLATVWLWISFGTVSTMISHSGFQFPQFPNPEIHDLHHSK
ncbi:Fatty acid hydroxylase domain-containing protein 2 [Araneus ventricosus]|uniref:Fatty acid hydroxylase domain-containing protein 2 n=1 Tax=Araneus ventricosus TaxID=182803 RepID=A0A4Y2L7H9_ARAVE|nr:Fatty acid hydroxylase domain-containing protein 2 [Araneus ventricosus]